MPLVEILGKIQHIFESVRIRVSNNNLFVVNVSNKHELHLHIGDKEIDHFTPQELDGLSKLINQYTETGEYLISSDSAGKKILAVSDVTTSQDEYKLLCFINTALPPQDRAVWISALALKQAHVKGDRVLCGIYKRDICISHGERGRNIANLCSSGYLEEFIMPLHHQAVEVLGKADLFNDMYNTFVQETQFIIFVSGKMTVKTLQKLIMMKIASMVNYGFQELHINAIGVGNINIAKKAVESVLESMKETIDGSSTHQVGTIIRISLTIKL